MTSNISKSGEGAEAYRGNLVRLDVCCNDPDNGSFDARAAALSLPDTLAEFGSYDFRGPVFREHSEAIQISRRRFACAGSKEWFGNWCWNAYWLDVADGVRLLAYVHTLRAFNCDMGEERLFARWHDERPLDAHDCEFLARQWVKASLSERRAA